MSQPRCTFSVLFLFTPDVKMDKPNPAKLPVYCDQVRSDKSVALYLFHPPSALISNHLSGSKIVLKCAGKNSAVVQANTVGMVNGQHLTFW